jgi:anthranilate synthase/aminodeoxychorismate synthase-like glutamine amidotransferase
MSVVIIDNQDSFTFNLYRYCQELGAKVVVLDSKVDTLDVIYTLAPSHLILSPGPGHPHDATLSLAVIEEFQACIPILGVCLGHQCLALAHGATIKPAKQICHGKTSFLTHHNRGLFRGLPTRMKVCRYHSLAIESQSLSNEFEISAFSDDFEIMAIKHRDYASYGVQFHPEACLSECGHQLLSNFLKIR